SAGAGLFMTPNTSAIMSSVQADRWGIANGARQTVQNAGWALSTALSLAIVIISLPGPLKEAAYSGSINALEPRSLASLTDGYRWALVTLGIICLLALSASLLRNRGETRPANTA